MTEPETGNIPLWAVSLRETVARIDERTGRIDTIAENVESLRRNTVPLNEHELLMQRVDQLWNRDLQARGDWEEVLQRVPVLWEERAERMGVTRWQNRVLAVMGALMTLLTGAVSVQALGIHISVRP